jgi:hypothetical protein
MTVGQNARSLCVPLGGALLAHRTLASLHTFYLHTFHLLTANNLGRHHSYMQKIRARPGRQRDEFG